ncbi:MAG TPA: enoyl-CoA hydratase/isomerase family protein, partial [Spirochaetes bacterium]|nr:enoyl-CoA hydratase/isomerase family protein [Spirochaetota bacterium]
MKYLNVNTENSITKIILNRPEKFNSFDLDFISDMAGLLISCAMDSSIEGIIISGNGRAFCAGGDLEWAARHKNGAACAFHELSSRFHQCVTEISS